MFNKGITEKLVGIRKEEFGLEVREFVNKTGNWREGWCQDSHRIRGRRFW